MVCCADHRADPAHVLGLQPNEVVVLRNPGGRVTPGVLSSLAVLGTIAAIEGFATGYQLILMQHTDCGITRLTVDDHSALLAKFFGAQPADVASRHHTDPRAAVRADVELLRANPLVPRTLVVSGAVYDVDTGRVETVVPPTPLGILDPVADISER
jgi:carbonic anhydrase